MEQEAIVLLENHNSALPLSESISSLALIGPLVDRVSFGDYVFFNATLNGVSPLAGFTQLLANSSNAFGFFAGVNLVMNRYNGSLPVTFLETGLQWDAPNAWPPHQYIALEALAAAGEFFDPEAQHDDEPAPAATEK